MTTERKQDVARTVLVGVMLVAALMMMGCETTSVRGALIDANNWSAEKILAYRDEAEVPFDRADKESPVVSTVPVAQSEPASGGVLSNWLTALIGILPDWQVRIQVLRVEVDIVTPETEADIEFVDEFPPVPVAVVPAVPVE